MSRSFIHLHRALFGVSCAVVFGFGATQAFGSPQQAAAAPATAASPHCNVSECTAYCQSIGGDYGVCSYPWGCACVF